jgi:hypothetical protein
MAIPHPILQTRQTRCQRPHEQKRVQSHGYMASRRGNPSRSDDTWRLTLNSAKVHLPRLHPRKVLPAVGVIFLVMTYLIITAGALSQPASRVADGGNTCLPLDASPVDQLKRALSDKDYPTCLRSLAKQQGRGCDLPTYGSPRPNEAFPADRTPQAEQAWWVCMKQRGCGVNCESRASAFRALAETAEAYHAVKKSCEQNAADVASCSAEQALRDISLPQIARSLTGRLSRTLFQTNQNPK